jgi:hypothetical protein
VQVLAFTRVGDGVTAKPIFCTTEEDGMNLTAILPVATEIVETCVVINGFCSGIGFLHSLYGYDVEFMYLRLVTLVGTNFQ